MSGIKKMAGVTLPSLYTCDVSGSGDILAACDF